MRVLAKTLRVRLSRKRGCPQRLNDPGFKCLPPWHWRAHGCVAIPRSVSQPWQAARIPPLQFGQQFAPHDRELVNMLVPVHVGGRAAGFLFKRIELGADFAADAGVVKRAQPTAQDEWPKRLWLQLQRVLREVQVQADLCLSGIHCFEFRGPLPPCWSAHHAAYGLCASLPCKQQRRLTDTGVQTKIVYSNAQAAAMLGRFMHTHSLVYTSSPRRLRGRIAWFVLVGTAAAAVHWSVVVMLVAHAGWRPLLANVLGWLIAFGVSFSGHYRWTFRDHGVPLWRSAMRFFAVSASGFAINETAYALLLHWSGLRYDLVLAVVLVAVAGGTYLLSRHWAFNRKPAR